MQDKLLIIAKLSTLFFSNFWIDPHRGEGSGKDRSLRRARSASSDAALRGSPEKSDDVNGGAELFAWSPAA